MVKVYIYDMDNLKHEEEYAYRRGNASAARRERMAEGLAASAVLDEALKEYGLREKDAVFTYGPYGKPALLDYPGIHFNLSHSGRYAMCAIGGVSVGADIQKDAGDKMAVARRFFSKEEYERLRSCPDGESMKDLFYRYWTLKESYAKALGKSIADIIGKARFAERETAGGTEGCGMALLDDGEPRHYFREYSLSGYHAAVCSEGDGDIGGATLVKAINKRKAEE